MTRIKQLICTFTPPKLTIIFHAGHIFTKILLCAAALLAVATSCRHGATAGAPQGDSASLQTFDLTDIENAGELIAVTLSGPETYYTYRGQEMGLQYLLAEHFTKSLGLGLAWR